MTQRLEIDWDGEDEVEFVVHRNGYEYNFIGHITDFDIATTYNNPVDIYTPPPGIISRSYRTFTLKGSIRDGIGSKLNRPYTQIVVTKKPKETSVGYTLSVHRFDATDPRLGRHVRHDSRNRQYEFRGWDMLDLASSVLHHSNIPVLNQGQIGACTGFAGAGLMGYPKFFEKLDADKQAALKNSGNATGLQFYHQATLNDTISGTYPPNDTGSDGPASAKGMTQLGYANGYKHAFSWNTFLSALQTGPVMVGTTWYNSMFNTSGVAGTVSVDPRSGVAGGHEYVAEGYDSTWVYFLNSWGTTFGNRGHFRVSVPQFQSLLADQGDITIPWPATAPAPTPTPPAPPSPTIDTDVKSAYSALKNWADRNNVH